ncbi:hypothetical protein BGW80DRAFT_221736 [Lactifluus volemus]|nr:hypothetical protein BGW80DRAFT_221736 [Lactifluus volemus]
MIHIQANLRLRTILLIPHMNTQNSKMRPRYLSNLCHAQATLPRHLPHYLSHTLLTLNIQIRLIIIQEHSLYPTPTPNLQTNGDTPVRARPRFQVCPFPRMHAGVYLWSRGLTGTPMRTFQPQSADHHHRQSQPNTLAMQPGLACEQLAMRERSQWREDVGPDDDQFRAPSRPAVGRPARGGSNSGGASSTGAPSHPAVGRPGQVVRGGGNSGGASGGASGTSHGPTVTNLAHRRGRL